MNRPILPLLSFSAALACSLSGSALAQVSSNLDNLPAAAPTQITPKHSPAHTAPHNQTTAPAHKATASSAPSPARSTVLPPVPASPPPPFVLPPPFVPVTLHPATPPETVTAVADAKSCTTPLPDGGLRVLFPSSDAALNDESIKTIRAYGTTLASHPEQRAVLLAYATLPGDDVSMPRRISLARALAVRSLLIQSGVPATRLYPRAIGRPDQGDQAPANRLDIEIQTNPTPSSTATPGMPAQDSPQK